MVIIITIVVTFMVTATWQSWATRKNKLPLQGTLKSLMNELNMMSEQLGYEDVAKFWESKYGSDYAKVALMNFENALKSLE